MTALLIGYQKVPLFRYQYSEKTPPITSFSIIIPFRNETEHLPDLLNSLLDLKYSFTHFEIIFVDDFSEDHSVKVIEDFLLQHPNFTTNLQIAENQLRSNSPKKDAISKAITIAKHPWIITTDADCIVPPNWLLTMDAFIQKKDTNMIVGPVYYQTNNGLINAYQQLDNFSLQATTIGSFGLKAPLLSNGANLTYKKDTFLAVNGFAGNNHLASGDDIFLLEKFAQKDVAKISFLKSTDAMVITKAENSWKEIIAQRIRWASKTSKQKNHISLALGGLIFITNFIIISLITLSLMNSSYGIHLALLFSIKSIIDLVFMYKHTNVFGLKMNFFSFIICEVLYPFVTIIVVFYSLFGTYTWKNRSFKK